MKRTIICKFEDKKENNLYSVESYPECCGVFRALLEHALVAKLEKFEVWENKKGNIDVRL